MDQMLNPQPWAHRRWRDGLCRHHQGRRVAVLVLLAVACCGAFASFAAWSPQLLRFARVRWLVLLPYALATAGACLLWAALLHAARWLRFSRCRVRLRTVPGVIGGHLRGEVVLPERFPEGADVHLELFCERVTLTRGSGEDDASSQRTSRDWSHTLRATAGTACVSNGSCLLPFDFAVPYGLPDETDSRVTETGRVTFRWCLRILSRLKGPDLNLTFHVPVFKTVASDPAVTQTTYDGKSLEDYLRDSGQVRRVRVVSEGGANVYVCDARGFQTGLCAVPSLVGLALLAVAVLLPAHVLPGLFADLFGRATGWQVVAWIIPVAFIAAMIAVGAVIALIGLLFLLVGLRGLIFRRTWVEQGEIRQRARLLGIPWSRRCSAASATGVSCSDSTSSGERTWYDVVIERKTAACAEKVQLRDLFGRLTVASNVPTRREAEDLAARLRRELRLPEGAEE